MGASGEVMENFADGAGEVVGVVIGEVSDLHPPNMPSVTNIS